MVRQIYALAAVILTVSMFRILPHPPNFTPVLAMALFAGAQIPDRRVAILVPLLAMFGADLVLGLHATLPFVYLSIILCTLLGGYLHQQRSISRLVGMALLSSVVFFIISNFGAWLCLPEFYPRTWDGLIAAYIAAIPFYHNTLISTVVFAGIFFGIDYLFKVYAARRVLNTH